MLTTFWIDNSIINMSKKITIETLADIVKKGFEESDKKTSKRFGESDKRTDEKIDNLTLMVQRRFEESDKRTDDKIDNLAMMVQKGFEETATKSELNSLARAIQDLELHLSASLSHKQEEIDHLKSWMQGMEQRVSFLESRYKTKK